MRKKSKELGTKLLNQKHLNIYRYLTQSRFKLGIECPTKLFYTNNKTTYGDSSADDHF